jgi:hypothetical protein
MKTSTPIRFLSTAICSLAFFASAAYADSVPELLHYRFDETGTTVTNEASAPPAGTATATIMGAITQTGTDLNFGGGGFSLLGSGNGSSTDYLNTGYAPDLTGSSWTISFVSSNIPSSSTLYYVFGETNSGSFRCFTNGVAGPNNWILRGAFTDVTVSGGATVATHRTTFVYDMTANAIYGYLDGVLVTTVPQTAVTITGAGPLKVMGYITQLGAPAGGLLDDFRLYNRALSAAEVAAIDTFSIAVVVGNGVDIEDGDTTPQSADDTDFGGAMTTSGSVTRTFTIRNDGNLDLNIGALTISGPEAADFVVTSPPGSAVIAPAGTTTFSIAFDPSADGVRTATVSLMTDDPAANPFDFAIQGIGLADAMFEDSFEDPN